MNDAEYEVQRERVKTLVAKWLDILPLRHWEITSNYYQGLLDRDDGKHAEALGLCEPDWRYMHATISWALGKVQSADDDQLERYVVHELMHCMLDQFTHYAERDRENAMDHSQVENQVQNLTLAIVWAHHDGIQAGRRAAEAEAERALRIADHTQPEQAET